MIALPRSLAWRVRSGLSLLLAAAILAVAVPAALGDGTWGGGVDPGRVFSAAPSASAQPADQLQIHPQQAPGRP